MSILSAYRTYYKTSFVRLIKQSAKVLTFSKLLIFYIKTRQQIFYRRSTDIFICKTMKIFFRLSYTLIHTHKCLVFINNFINHLLHISVLIASNLSMKLYIHFSRNFSTITLFAFSFNIHIENELKDLNSFFNMEL